MTGVENHAAEILADGELSPICRDWLREGLHDHIILGTPLHIALGLSRAALQRAQRDAALRSAHMLIDAPSSWLKCLSLAGEIDSFASRVWPRLRDLDSADPSWSSLRTALFNAFRSGARCDLSARQLSRIIAGCDIEGDGNVSAPNTSYAP